MIPSVGRIVHYVSRGSADGRFPSECRAAVVTAVDESDDPIRFVSLAVLNPTGLFFDEVVVHAPEEDGLLVAGTWHWPERVDE